MKYKLIPVEEKAPGKRLKVVHIPGKEVLSQEELIEFTYLDLRIDSLMDMLDCALADKENWLRKRNAFSQDRKYKINQARKICKDISGDLLKEIGEEKAIKVGEVIDTLLEDFDINLKKLIAIKDE